MDEFMFLEAADHQKATNKIPVHVLTIMKIKRLDLMLSSTHLSPDRKTLTIPSNRRLSVSIQAQAPTAQLVLIARADILYRIFLIQKRKSGRLQNQRDLRKSCTAT